MKEVRVVRYGGEDYVNVNDLASVMFMLFKSACFTTLPVIVFIKTIIYNLQGGNHD